MTMNPKKEPIDPLLEIKRCEASVRIDYLEDDNHVVTYPAYDQINIKLHKLMNRSFGVAPQMFAFTGLTGMGKSTLLEQLAAENSWYERERRRFLPVLYVTLPDEATPSSIKERMLSVMNASSNRKMTKAKLNETVFWNLRKNQVRLVIFDELQHVDGVVSNKDYRVALNFFKDIVSYAKIPVVLSGLYYACNNALKVDTQIKRRSGDLVIIPGWSYSEELASFLEAYEQTLPLRNSSDLGSDAMTAAIAQYCNGTTDHICRTIRKAARFELSRENEKISLKTFSDMGLKHTPNLKLKSGPDAADRK